MHCHVHYKSPHSVCSDGGLKVSMILTQNVLLIIVSRIGGKLGAESAGNEHVARAQQFYSAKKRDV